MVCSCHLTNFMNTKSQFKITQLPIIRCAFHSIFEPIEYWQRHSIHEYLHYIDCCLTHGLSICNLTNGFSITQQTLYFISVSISLSLKVQESPFSVELSFGMDSWKIYSETIWKSFDTKTWVWMLQKWLWLVCNVMFLFFVCHQKKKNKRKKICMNWTWEWMYINESHWNSKFN